MVNLPCQKAGKVSHYYNSRGDLVSPNSPKALPSPTTILDVMNKPGLNEWRLRVGASAAYTKQTESAARGTAIHQLVSDWINGNTTEAQSPDHEEMLLGYINWQEKYKPTECSSELFVRSEEHGYAGTLDLRCRLDGDLWIIDLKTSKQISPEFGLQIRAYEQASFEQTGEHARMAVLQLTPENKSRYRFKEVDEPLEAFLAVKRVFDWVQSHAPKSSLFDGRTITSR